MRSDCIDPATWLIHADRKLTTSANRSIVVAIALHQEVKAGTLIISSSLSSHKLLKDMPSHQPSSGSLETLSTTNNNNGTRQHQGNIRSSTTHPLLLGNAPNPKVGELEVAILSAYDLPYAEAPSCISLQIGDLVQKTGPPLAKHKDRNSFRFSSNNDSSSAGSDKSSVQLKAPLPTLYKSKLTVKVLYNNVSKVLTSDYDLHQLRIHERKWVIMTLTDSNQATSLASSTAFTASNSGLPEDVLAPTIRVKLHLSGPYRPEVAALIGLSKAWFGVVDGCQDNMVQVWKQVPKLPFDKMYLAVPAVPLIATLVVASPVVAGILIVGLPFLLPIIVSIVGILGSVLVGAGCVYASSKDGRAFVGGFLHPITESILHSRSGQTLIYETGPRPTPVSVAKLVLPVGIWSKLTTSLLIDLIGSSSYLLPVVGEGLDLFWAPMQTVLIMAMYESTSPNLKYVSFVEEALPFTDIVPSATIGWTLQYLIPQVLGKNGTTQVEQFVHALARQHPERTTANVPTTTISAN